MTELFFVLPLIKKFGYFYFDIAKIPLASNPFSFLFVWISRLLGTRRATLQAAVPVMRHEAFTFMPLRGAMRIDVVNMREICLESGTLLDSPRLIVFFLGTHTAPQLM